MHLSKKITMFVMFLGFIPGLLPAQNLELNSTLPIDKQIITGTLDNGMKYYIRKNENPKNRAELTLAVKTGSIDEDDDQQGLAHFCEHMAFNGTKNFPKRDLVNYLESIGMKFGAEVNAGTSFEQTVYRITVPLDSIKMLDKGLMVLFDWAGNVLYENEEIDKERGIIHEEWRMGQGAQDRMMRKMLPVIFYNSQYAKRIPIGTMDIIDKCPYDALKKFYKDWYRPDLMAVIAVGDFDEKQMEKKVKELFSKIPKPVSPREKKKYDIPDHNEPLVAVITDKEAQYTVAQIFYKHDKFKQKTVKNYRTALAHDLFSSMITKRLQEMTLLPNPPFIQAACMYTKFLGPKDIYLSFAMTKNIDLERGMEAVLTENERVKKFGFTATELEREKKSLLREIEKQYNERNKEKSQSILQEITANFISEDPITGIEFEYELCKKYFPDIKLEEVNAFAKEWITDKNMVSIIMAPEKEDVKVPTEARVKEIIASVKTKDIKPYEDKVINKPLVNKEPAPGKIDKKSEDKKLGTVEWTLSNGIKAVFKNTDFKKDEILFTAYSIGGSSNNKQEDAVSADIAADVISESGVGDYDKTDLEKYLSDKVVWVDPWIREEEEGMDGQCSPKDFETMMQLVYMYFTSPRKDKNAFNSYLAKKKGELENKAANPEMVFRDSITCILNNYHPRKRPQSVKWLDEANFNRVHYVYNQRFGDPGNFIFYFVGNIDLKIIEPFVLKYIGGLPQVTRTETFKDLGIENPKGKIDKTVNKGKEPKSMVFLSFNGDFEWNMNNKADIEVLSNILNIKLIESIREDKSGVYTIGSVPQLTHYPKGKYNFIIFFPCSPDNVDKLTNGVIEEMDKLRNNGPTETDLGKAKEQKLRDRETNLRENNFWLTALKNLSFHNENASAILEYENYVKSLTIDKLKQTANKYFDRNNYVRVVLKPE